MTCAEVSRLTPLYLSGELDPIRTAEFATHLDHCSACAGELNEQAILDDEVRTAVLGEPLHAAAMRSRVIERLQGRRARARRKWAVTFGAAATVLLAAGAVVYRTHSGASARAFDAAAARDHEAEIVERQPRRWIADAAAIRQLAERQGISAAEIPLLTAAGYRLVEGKLCRLNGRVFLHLVYDDGAGELSLFLRRDGEMKGMGAALRHWDFGPDHVAGFRSAGVDVVCVTGEPGDAALRFAGAAAAAL